MLYQKMKSIELSPTIDLSAELLVLTKVEIVKKINTICFFSHILNDWAETKYST